jgi:hypothetical protein
MFFLLTLTGYLWQLNWVSVISEKINPKVAVSVWTGGDSKGYQFKGDARIETAGKVFEDSVKWVNNAEPQLSPKAAVVVKVDSVYVTSPGPDAGKRIS